MSAAPKNLAASVKARLQNEATRRGESFTCDLAIRRSLVVSRKVT